MLKHLKLVVLCVGLAACTVSGADETPLTEAHVSATETVSISDLVADSESGTVVIDLRSSAARYQFEPGVDYGAVDVICPGDRSMNMKSWLPELAVEFHMDVAELEAGFIMYASSKGGTMNAAPVCEEGCHAHYEFNKWVCLC
jgi:hypothetical protein